MNIIKDDARASTLWMQVVALQPKVSFKDEVKNIMKYLIYHVIFENVAITNHTLLERFLISNAIIACLHFNS
jgi:hypothetical protein